MKVNKQGHMIHMSNVEKHDVPLHDGTYVEAKRVQQDLSRGKNVDLFIITEVWKARLEHLHQ